MKKLYLAVIPLIIVLLAVATDMSSMSKGEARNIITNAHKVSNGSYPTTLSSTDLMYMDECEVLELHGKDFDLSCLDGSVRHYPDNIDYVLDIASHSQDHAFATMIPKEDCHQKFKLEPEWLRFFYAPP